MCCLTLLAHRIIGSFCVPPSPLRYGKRKGNHIFFYFICSYLSATRIDTRYLFIYLEQIQCEKKEKKMNQIFADILLSPWRHDLENFMTFLYITRQPAMHHFREKKFRSFITRKCTKISRKFSRTISSKGVNIIKKRLFL